jgi:guanylate kinase
MKNIIFAIYGVSGGGKSTFIEILSKVNSSITIHKKDTTREPDDKEIAVINSELNFLDIQKFDSKRERGEYEVVYLKHGNYYGVLSNQLTESFEKKKIHCIIVRDIIALKELKNNFLNLKTIYFHVDPSIVPERLAERDRYDTETRREKIKEEFKEYVENNTLFDHTIVNFWEISNAVRQLQNIINHYI